MHKLMGFVCAAALGFVVGCGPTDGGIWTSVNRQLASDQTVNANDVEVTTEDGIVTLSGTVETAAERERAIQIARDTDGVRDVIDQLAVREMSPTTGNDRDITAEPEEPHTEGRESRPGLPGDDREIVQ